jgi:hypothetical protein
MEFKKYNSIENHYRQKFIDKMLYHNPEAADALWIAREKLDGANIQLVFSPNEPMKVGKRSQYITPDDNFFDIWETLARYSHEVDVLQRYAKLYNTNVRFYGEIYGPGINGRVNYGEAKRIAIFDAEIDSKLLTQEELESFLYARNFTHLLPKQFAKGKLMDVLQVDVEVGNCEGVVIKPYDRNFFMNELERFIIKKKAQSFLDQERNEGKPARENTSDVAYNINKEFMKYINENRVLDVFAKHGPITEPKQIGEYIKLVIEDAKQDFLKDHDLNVLIPGMTEKQERMVYNVGGVIVGFLKKHL